MPSRHKDRTGTYAAAFFSLWALLALAWVSFIVWAIYSVVTWLVAQ